MRIIRLLAFALVVALLAACGSDDEPADTSPPANESTAQTTIDRPEAPAPENSDFRSDPGSVVAATGNPQLLEFFTYW